MNNEVKKILLEKKIDSIFVLCILSQRIFLKFKKFKTRTKIDVQKCLLKFIY